MSDEAPATPNRDGMTGAEIANLLNLHRDQLQQETVCVSDAVTVCAFLLWSFLMDQERQGFGTAAGNFENLALMMPTETARMGLQFIKGAVA